jgi:hypothetical protein
VEYLPHFWILCLPSFVRISYLMGENSFERHIISIEHGHQHYI